MNTYNRLKSLMAERMKKVFKAIYADCRSGVFSALIAGSICYVFAGLLSGCEKQPNYKYIHDNSTGKLGMSAWGFIQQNDSLTLMKEAVEAAGLSALYDGSDVHTFLIPTNGAFRNYLKANNYATLSSVPTPILRNTLLYHIVDAKVLFSDTGLSRNDNPIGYLTENGQQMYLSHNANYQGLVNQGTNNSWTISESNLQPTNGVIHIVPDVVYYSAITAPAKPNTSIESDTAYAIQDAYVNGGSFATTNFGSDPLIKVKNVDGSGDYDRKIYLMYDLNNITKKGKLRKATVEVGVNFTAALGLKLMVYAVPGTDWSENSINWNNAPAPGIEIARITSTKVSEFVWDCTDYIEPLLEDPKKISLMITAEDGGNETDDLISKENSLANPPRLVVTLSSGNSQLAMGVNKGLTVEKGGVALLSQEVLEMEGAEHADISYALTAVPAHGWLVTGTTILKAGSKFSQLDIDGDNIVYVSDGSASGTDKFSVSVSDPDGGSIDPFDFLIKVN